MTDPVRLGLDSPRQIGEDVAEAYMLQQAGALALERYIEFGLQRTIAVPTPAAGTDWVQVVPPGAVWEVLAITSLFTASAVVATRSPTLLQRDQDGVSVMRFSSGSNVTVSAATRETWAAGLGSTVLTALASAPLPERGIVWPSGYSVAVSTGSLDVGDQWSQIFLTVREWSLPRIAQRLRYLLADLDSAGGLL